jgi:hypothetical protein
MAFEARKIHVSQYCLEDLMPFKWKSSMKCTVGLGGGVGRLSLGVGSPVALTKHWVSNIFIL